MLHFLLGVLVCWTVFAILTLVGDHFNWFFEDWYLFIFTFPVLLVVMPLYFGYAFLLHPWRNVWRPVEAERFNEIVRGDPKLKTWRLVPRLFVCWQPDATIINRLFFVRIRRERVTP